MNTKRVLTTSTLAAGIAAAGLFGVGMGTASADPGQPCGAPGNAACQPDNNQNHGNQGNPGNPGNQNNQANNQRGIDQGRQDHQPFSYQGQHVTPLPAGNGAGWGFWFLGRWIAL
jgi:hypothetical protein